MIDIKEKDLLDIIFELTHIKNEEGEDVPHFCFASDVAVDLNATDEEIAIIALNNGYKAFKVFPGETMLGGIVLLADGANIEPVEAMYKEFYGEVPEISELKLDDDGHLKEIDSSESLDEEEQKIETLEDKIRRALDHNGSQIRLFELEQGETADWSIEKFDDEDIDFGHLICYDVEKEDRMEGKPVATFMLTGGENGSGNWDDYLDDLRQVFNKLRDETGYSPVLYKVETDICDDVWNGYVLLYDRAEYDIDESVNKLSEAFKCKFGEYDHEDALDESKNKRPKIKKVGDPNAKAMWGRTRHRVEMPKKGKGSFKRHPKHRLGEVYETPKKEDVDRFLQMLKDDGWTIEYCREDESLHGGDDVKQYHIQIIDDTKFPVEVPEGATDKEMIDAHRQYCESGHDTEVWGRAEDIYDIIKEFDPERKYNMTYSASFGGRSSTGIDCTGRITAGIDMRPVYVEDSFVEIGEELDEVSIEDAVWTGAAEYAKSFEDKAKEAHAELQLFTDISPQRKDSDWYEGMIAELEFEDCLVDIYASGEWRINLDGKDIYDPWDLEQAGIFTDEQLSQADKEGRVEWIQNNWFNFTISSGNVTLSDWDMGYDDVSYNLDEALDIEFYIKEAIPEFKRHFVDDLENSEVVTESKKKKKNILKKTAEKHAATDKKGAKGWFVNHNAGNVELNIKHFNNVNGNSSESSITAPAGLGEDVDLEIGSDYSWEFDSFKKYITVGYSYDDETGPARKYYYARIPETCVTVDRDTYKDNKLLRRRKNKVVMNGVEDFFRNHPHAKHCVIGCRDVTKHNRYVNAYRVLAESLIKESQDDYWVLSDGQNPRRSRVYSEIIDLDSFIDKLEKNKGESYWELLHYVKGNPTKVWSTKEGRIQEELDLDIIGDESPEGIEFEAQPRENFMYKKWRYGGISYPEFRCPSNGKQIFKKAYREGKYALCKAADVVIDEFFKNNPLNKYCVLLAYKDGKPVGTEIMSGGKEGIWGKEADESLNEKAEKHDTLNPKLWDESNNLKPEVREKILEIVKEFTDGLEEDEIKFKIDDIVLVGSNCSYNYNDKSDLDIHIRMDTDSLECPDDLYPLLYSAYRSLFNNKLDIEFYGIPVEIYVETSETEQMNDEPIAEARKQSALKSNGIFSVMNNKWIKEPVAEDIPETDQEAFDKEFKKWEERYHEVVRGEDISLTDSPMSETLKSVTEKHPYEYYGPIYRFGRVVKSDVHLVTWAVSLKKAINNLLFKAAEEIGYRRDLGAEVDIDRSLVRELELVEPQEEPEDKRELCPNCGKFELNDSGECPLCDLGDESVLDESIEDDKIEEIEDFIEDIYDLRKTSISNDGEYGIGNLVFKEVRNLGWLDNLKELKNALKSKKLSLESLDEHLTKSELQREVPKITEDDVRSWIGDDIGWDMTIDPDTLKKADYNNLPNGWIVTQDFGLDNLFNTRDYAGMTEFIKDILMRFGDKYYIGTYKMKYGKYRGDIAIDVNRIINNTEEAIVDGIRNNQESIYRFDEYIFLTHNLISRKDGKKKPYPFLEEDLKEYGLDKYIIDKPKDNCLNIEMVDEIKNTNIPVPPKKKAIKFN